MKSILNVINLKKKPSNLIKVIFSYNNFSGIKSQQAKNRFFIQYKKLNFSQNTSTPCHQVTFDHSISCVPLIDKPNEICKNSKTYERNALSTTNFFKRQLQDEISKAFLPVSADLSNDFESIILKTEQRKLSPFMRLFW